MKSYDEWIMSFTSNQKELIYNSTIYNKEKIISKWFPVMEDYFRDMNLNKELMEYICIYAETYSIYESLLPQLPWHPGMITSATGGPYTGPFYGHGSQQQNILLDRIEEIKKYIINLNKNRKSNILRKVFNYETGHAEYELEDGNFVKILASGKLESPKIDTYSILPKSLLKLINPIEYREEQLNSILDDNR